MLQVKKLNGWGHAESLVGILDQISASQPTVAMIDSDRLKYLITEKRLLVFALKCYRNRRDTPGTTRPWISPQNNPTVTQAANGATLKTRTGAVDPIRESDPLPSPQQV